MVRKHNPANRGIGEHRFEQIRRSRPSKRLEDGQTLLYEHALRCLCQRCKKLLNWDCPEDISYTETECCGIRYRLRPWTVIVETEDVSSRAILPKMTGSDYSDPETDLSHRAQGEFHIEPVILPGLSAAQRSLGAPAKPYEPLVIDSTNYDPPIRPPEPPKPPEPPTPPQPKKPKRRVRRCSICRKPGHTKRKCPEA